MVTSDGVKPWRDMTPDERFADQFRHFPTLLGRWRGGRARLWSYSVSHNSLAVRVERAGVLGNLHVHCSAESISGPVAWDGADIEIVPAPGGGVLIQDRAAGVRILATTVSVAENVEPVSVGA